MKVQKNYHIVISGEPYIGTYTEDRNDVTEETHVTVDTIFNAKGDNVWDDELADKIEARL